MVESVKIFLLYKKVLLLEIDVGCFFVDMVIVEDVENLKKKYFDYLIVCYINFFVFVKVKLDVICILLNVVKIVREFFNDKIIFLLDKNLGSFVRK